MRVGVREFKSHLSDYLARVGDGEDIVATDRGRPIVRLVPYVAASDVDLGIEEGWIEAPRRSGLDPVVRVRSDRSTRDVLDEDRG